MRILNIAAAALLVGATASAQDEPARRAATEVAARVPLERAMKGAPYSAETIVEGSQTLADGNRINRKTTGRVYRDGEGRTRREEDRPNGPVTISITDPVAGYSYSLDTTNKVAWRTPMGAAGAIMGKVEASQVDAERRLVLEKMTEARKAGASDEQSREVLPMRTPTPAQAGGGGGRGEAGGTRMRSPMPAMAPTPAGPLEHKTIEGVPVEGRKTTTTIPAGQVGNEQPLNIVSEQWRSPDLNILVMTRHVDPRSGESTYRLTNIIRAEPDRSLFMVPPDYEVKDTGIRRMLEASRKPGL
jgi:hypothetical protein